MKTAKGFPGVEAIRQRITNGGYAPEIADAEIEAWQMPLHHLARASRAGY